MDFNTRCVHGGSAGTPCGQKGQPDHYGAVAVPIYQTATFAHPGVGLSTGYDYSRVQNPTREHLERLVANLEGGCEALAFSSGMAALTAIMALFRCGDHMVCSADLYGGSFRLFRMLAETAGLTFTAVDSTDLAAVEAAIRPETRSLFIETPTNPMMHVTDLAAAAELAHRHNLLLIVDNTFLTPYFQKPIALGADLVLHSGTKYLGGHNDTLAGLAVVADPALAERLRMIYKTTGACLAPLDSWLLIRGIKTLALRLDRQQENALVLARWLQQHPRVRQVHYIGLPDHPQYDLSCRQGTGFGSMVSFEVDRAETACRLLERVALMLYAESLGGTETLVTYPMLQTHADVPEQQRQALGIHDRLLRLSVGIEHIDDLLADFAQALG